MNWSLKLRVLPHDNRPAGRTQRASGSPGTMWPPGVAIDPPGFDGPAGVGQIDEPVFVQTFIPELSVKAFDELQERDGGRCPGSILFSDAEIRPEVVWVPTTVNSAN